MARKSRGNETVQPKRTVRGRFSTVDGNADAYAVAELNSYLNALAEPIADLLTSGPNSMADRVANDKPDSMPATGSDELDQEAGHLDKVPDGSNRRNK